MKRRPDRGLGGRLTRAVGPLCFVAILGACPYPDDNHRTAEAWLTCDECIAGELDSLTALGASRYGWTVGRLGWSLEGLDSVRHQNLRLQFAANYRRIPNPQSPEVAYVESFLDNYIAVYQKRAAIALGAIGGSDAIDELNEALARDSSGQLPLRPDVRQVVVGEIIRATTQDFQGTLAPAFAGVLDTITVTPGPATAGFDGDEDVVLNGGPFPTSVLVSSAPTALRFVAAAEPGTYGVTITGLDASAGDRSARLTLSSIPYEPRDPINPSLASPDPVPGRWFTALTGYVSRMSGLPAVEPATGLALGTPLDHFMVTTASDTAAVARLEWRAGDSELAAHWWECDALVAPPTSITMLVVDSNLDPVQGAQVELTGAGGVSTQLTDPTGSARFDGLIAAAYGATASMVGFIPRTVSPLTPGTHGVLMILSGGSVRTASADTASVQIDAGDCWTLRVMKADTLKAAVIGKINVDLSQAVASVTIVPPVFTLNVGETQLATAELRAADGTSLDDRSVQWRSDDPSVATVNVDGTVTAVGVGSTNIEATVEGVSGSVDMTVP